MWSWDHLETYFSLLNFSLSDQDAGPFHLPPLPPPPGRWFRRWSRWVAHRAGWEFGRWSRAEFAGRRIRKWVPVPLFQTWPCVTAKHLTKICSTSLSMILPRFRKGTLYAERVLLSTTGLSCSEVLFDPEPCDMWPTAHSSLSDSVPAQRLFWFVRLSSTQAAAVHTRV